MMTQTVQLESNEKAALLGIKRELPYRYASTIGSQEDGNNTKSKSNGMMCFFNCLFYSFCFLSGQYICDKVHNNTKKPTKWNTFILVTGFFLFVGQSCAYLVHITLNILLEICRVQNVSYCTQSLSNQSFNCTVTHEYWKFVASILTSTFAASVSYVLMTVLILIPVYSCCCRFCTVLNKKKDGKSPVYNCCLRYCTALNKELRYGKSFCPFHDGDHRSIVLTSKQALCFYFNYFLSLLLLGLCILASLIYGSLVAVEKPCLAVAINFTSLVLYLLSQFCSTQSIFIFSRIVYIITGQLTQLMEILDKVNVAKITLFKKNGNELEQYMHFQIDDTNRVDLRNLPDENMGRYYLLQNIDQEFIKQVKPILRLFGIWFLFHWILNALTTVLLSAVILELVINPLQYKSIDHVVPVEDAGHKTLYILFMIFFTLGHSYQFIYPCFRAASITSVREKLIRDVSKKYWRHIPIPVKDSFINYLRVQNFSFKVSIFCAEFSFSFNWAFVSLFIVICGGFLRF